MKEFDVCMAGVLIVVSGLLTGLIADTEITKNA